MQLSLNTESANALRDFAAAMPLAMGNIMTDTETLLRTFQSVSETLGVHAQDFSDMLAHIKKAQEDADEAVGALPPMLSSTADKIDDDVASRPSIGNG